MFSASLDCACVICTSLFSLTLCLLSSSSSYFPSPLFFQGTDSEEAASSSGEDEDEEEGDDDDDDGDDGDGDHSDLSESELVHAKTKAGLAAASKIINSSFFLHHSSLL